MTTLPCRDVLPRRRRRGAVRRIGRLRPDEEDSRWHRAVLGARRAAEGHAWHRPRGREDGIPGCRVLLAVLQLDDRPGQRSPQASRRSRHQVPVDAQQPPGDLRRRHGQGRRAQSDHRQQIHHRRQRRQDLGRRRLEGVRRPAGGRGREAARAQHGDRLPQSSGRVETVRGRRAADGYPRQEHAEETSSCSSMPARPSRSEPMPSPGSRPTPAGSRASTSRTGARPAPTRWPSERGTCRGSRCSRRPSQSAASSTT